MKTSLNVVKKVFKSEKNEDIEVYYLLVNDEYLGVVEIKIGQLRDVEKKVLEKILTK